MSYFFGEKSRIQYMTLDRRLQDILDVAIHVMDFSIICGYRNKKDQDKAYKNNKSDLKFPFGKHNKKPSFAVDLLPYPVRWPDKEKQTKEEYAECLGRFYLLAGIILAIAHQKNIKLQWGGSWRSKDLVHFELV